ncbi:MAG: tetratricopeptide repeat protein [Acidobacteria bacterium]|nr:tetratricopeptide repeat protein [Acidobacteriota bacterium]
MGTRKLTRKDIVREDRVHAALSGIYEWSQVHRKWLIVIPAVVLAAILGAYLWRIYQRGRDERLQNDFAEALKIHHATVGSEASQSAPLPSQHRFATEQERHKKSLERFTEIAQQNPSSPLGLWARYYVALNKNALGEKEEAGKLAAEIVQESDDVQLQNLARYFLAQQAQAEKHFSQAAELLQQILKSSSQTFPKQAILLSLGESYEALGRKEEALKQYRELSSKYPTSEYSRQAQDRIARIETEKKLAGKG